MLVSSSDVPYPCRSDPTLVLHDGRHIKVIAHVDANIDVVTSLTIIVHGPTGTSLDRVLYVGPDRFPEVVEYLADGADETFVAHVTLAATVDAAVMMQMQISSAKAEAGGRTNTTVQVALAP
jgi:hypothetical protein